MSQAISTAAAAASPATRATFDADAGVIKIPTHVENGFLLFDPAERKLNEVQMAMLAPLGIKAHWPAMTVANFLMDCLSRGFDPWSREAYLMEYKTAQGPAYVHHIGIAGFRKHSEATRQYEGSDPILYYDAEGTSHRVWLRSDIAPYAAEITVYRKGHRPKTVVALFDEYAPTTEEWVDDPTKPRKEDGQAARMRTGHRVPVPMWRPGPRGGMVTVMLGKCAEAAALRAQFPNTFNGWYAEEEMMAAADGVRGEDVPESDVERRRREAYEQATRPAARPGDLDGDAIGVTVTDAPPAPRPAAYGDPVEQGDVPDDQVPDDAEAPLPSEDDVRVLLLAELAAQAAIIGKTPAWMVMRWERAHAGQDFPSADLGEIAAHVRRFRDVITGELRKQGRHEMADRYAGAPIIGTVRALFGCDLADLAPAGANA